MSRKISVTDAEWEVMEVLWDSNPVSSRYIIKHLKARGWKPTTIRTLLARLIKKKFAGSNEGEYAYTYFPLVSRDDLVKSETEHMLNKLYKGSFSSMVTGLLGGKKLTEEDRTELKKILSGFDIENDSK